MTPTLEAVKLPELPEPQLWDDYDDVHGYTADQMLAFRDEGIRAALAGEWRVPEGSDRDGALLTYTGRQPNNSDAFWIYEAFKAAKPGGDFIDHGLSITQQLELRGLGLVRLPDFNEKRAAQAAADRAAPLPKEPGR